MQILLKYQGMDFKNNLSFSQLTTLEIGGPIKEFVEVKTEEELTSLLSQLPTFMVIGGGSNLLVSDEGFDGLVIQNKIAGIEQKGNTFIVKSGTNLQELIDLTIEQGFSEMHKLNGIPGTVGGALYGNAGAFGQTISDHLTTVTILNPTTHPLQPITISKTECEFEYRDSGFKRTKNIILEAFFKLPKVDPSILEQESQEVLERRQKKYPPGVKCPGSFFKNLFIKNLPEDLQKQIPPERDYFGKVPAWFFLDEVGAKGAQKGQIKIAPYHGNLFINLGNGTAEDFYTLAKEYFDKVKARFGISLDPEVQLINLPKF